MLIGFLIYMVKCKELGRVSIVISESVIFLLGGNRDYVCFGLLWILVSV